MAESWPTETFADLAALAAKGDGSLVRVRDVPIEAWTYVGAPLGTNSANSLRMPLEYILSRRIWGAIVRGLWIPIAADEASALNAASFGQADQSKFFVGEGASRVNKWLTDPTFLPNDLSSTFNQVVPAADARARKPPRTLATAGSVG